MRYPGATVYDSPMSESKEQSKLLKSMKAHGVPTQKFTDEFSHGIPDMWIGTPTLPDVWPGGWLEAKFHLQPKLRRTPLLPKAKITGNQISWLRRNNRRPNPCAVIHFTGEAWMVCPIEHLHVLTDLPSGSTAQLLRTTPVSRVSTKELWHSYCEVESFGTNNPPRGE